MSTNELNLKVKELKELKMMLAELQDQISSIENAIKSDMETQGKEELIIDQYKLSYKTVSSSRFDSKSFKAKYEELYKAFCKTTTYKRFTVA